MAPNDQPPWSYPPRAGFPPKALGVGLEDLERLRGLVTALTRDPATTDDVLQETWLASRRMPAAVDTPGQVAAWLRTTARRLAGRRLRDERSRSDRERVAARREVVEDVSAERIESFAELLEALGELSEPYRSAVRLRYLDGLAPREIAKQLDRSPELVRQHLHRGLERLRSSMDRRYGGDERSRQAWMTLLVPVRSGTVATSSVVALTLTTILMKLWILPIAALVVGALFLLPSREGPEASAAGPVAAEEAAALVSSELEEGSAVEPVRTAIELGEELVISSVDLPESSVKKPEIRLRFVDFETRVPLPTAELRVLDRTAERGEEPRQLRPEPDGTLTFDVPVGQRAPTLLVVAPGYGRTVLQDDSNWFGTGEVFEVELYRKTRVSGRVVGPNGVPVAGAQVFGAGDDALRSAQFKATFQNQEGHGMAILFDTEFQIWQRLPRAAQQAHRESVRTGADGYFSVDLPLAPLPIGPEFPSSSGPFLVVAHPDFERLELRPGSEQELYALASGAAELTLAPHEPTTGITVDESGRGIPGVQLVPAQDGDLLEDLTWIDQARSLTSVSGGRFAGDLDLESTEVLWCLAEGYADRRLVRADFALEDGELRVPMERGYDLVVQVFDDSGVPVPGILVEVEPFRELAKTELEAHTDANGLATFERLGRGAVEVGVKTGGGYLSEPGRDVEVPTSAVVFQLARPVRFTGDLLGLAGEREELQFELDVQRDDDEPVRQALDDVILEGGRYSAPLEDARVDRARLVVSGGEGLQFIGPWFEVDAGIVELDVEFESEASESTEGVAAPPE